METVGASCLERLTCQAVEGRRFFACAHEGGASGQFPSIKDWC